MGRSTKTVGSSRKNKNNFCGECGTDLRKHVCHQPITIAPAHVSPPTPCAVHCYCQSVYVGWKLHQVCCKCGDRTSSLWGITWSGTSPYYTISSDAVTGSVSTTQHDLLTVSS